MFRLHQGPLDSTLWRAALHSSKAGAQVEFEGLVRDHNDGRPVTGLEYQVYEALALIEGENVLAEARERFPIEKAIAVHAHGALEIGQTAVWVGVLAAHRDGAFKACRYVIDQLKTRLPIWKKEFYRDAEPVWVNCQACSRSSSGHLREDVYYARQHGVVGDAGQERLKRAHLLVVGAGGLGVPVLTYLAGAGVGQLRVCDGDRLEASNLHRQTMYAFAEIGQNKARLAAEQLRQRNPWIRVESIASHLTSDNCRSVLDGCEVVVDCTDNFSTRFLLNNACQQLQVPLISASIYRDEGLLQVFLPDSAGGCLRCLWPTMPHAAVSGPCTDVGVLGAAVGALGAMQALETIRWIVEGRTDLADKSLLVNLRDYSCRPIGRERRWDCPVCGSIGEDPVAKAAACDVDSRWELSMESIDPDRDLLIDLREAGQAAPCVAARRVIRSPLSSFDSSLVKSHRRTVLACAFGQRSRLLAMRLRAAGHSQVFYLRDGLESNVEGVSAWQD